MRKFNRLLAVCLAFVLCVMTVASVSAASSVNGYTYEYDEYGMASIIGWDNSSETLYIPDKLGGTYVSQIGNSAFRNDTYIKQLDFSDASKFDAIGMFAFANSALEGKLTVPTKVAYIGISAFSGCNNLTEVSYSSDGGSVVAQCFYNCSNLGTVTLSSYITTIERYAFANCTNLTSVTIPATVTSINKTAFYNCPNAVIYCYTDSYAHQFAQDNGIEFVLLDAPEPTVAPTEEPTAEPTVAPTDAPTDAPTEEPTAAPTDAPTVAPTAEPTAAPTEAPTEAPTDEPTSPAVMFMLGDADGNGDIEIIDSTLIQRYLSGLSVPVELDTLMNGDVDADGELSIIDVGYIMRYLANLQQPFAIGQYVAK